MPPTAVGGCFQILSITSAPKTSGALDATVVVELTNVDCGKRAGGFCRALCRKDLKRPHCHGWNFVRFRIVNDNGSCCYFVVADGLLNLDSSIGTFNLTSVNFRVDV